MTSSLNTDIEKFEELGYVIIKNYFDRDKALSAAKWLRSQDLNSMAKSMTDQEPGVELAVWQNVHKGQHPVAEMVSDSKLLEIASKLMDDEAYIWSSKVNLKAAWCGTAEYYHQDYIYWKDRGYKKIDMLACSIFLDDHGVHNGGLHIFPKSHKMGCLEHMPFININGLQKFMVPPKELSKLNEKCSIKVVEAEAGDVLFFHSGIVHGSSHNISPNPRMIALAQLNIKNNLPNEVQSNTKKYNLWRTEFAMNAANDRLRYYSKKYEEQKNTSDILYNSPIQGEEDY
jgi:ectoine hydroxylase